MIALVCIEPAGPSAAAKVALRVACNSGPNISVVTVSIGSAQQFRKSPPLVLPGAVARVLRVQDPALADSNADTTAMLLTEVARHIKAAVVLVGEQSSTEGHGLVGAAVAHHWQAPYLAAGQALQATDRPDHVRVTVYTGGRLCEVLSPAPVVVATPPMGPLADTLSAEIEVPAPEVLSLDELSIESSRLVRRPDLRGTMISTPAQVVRNTTFEQAARWLLRRA